ncbi:hypothetical protein UlMin_000868 [Ulmus minor]
MGVSFTVGVFRVLILAHAAYSTIQYGGLLKITEEEFSGPPMNVMVELILGSVFCIWVALTVLGKFLLIHPNLDKFLSFLKPFCPLLLDLSSWPHFQRFGFRCEEILLKLVV